LVSSLIGAIGSASGATVQNIAATPSLLMHQNYDKSGARQPISHGFFCNRLKPHG
jgi:hypothetical protein